MICDESPRQQSPTKFFRWSSSRNAENQRQNLVDSTSMLLCFEYLLFFLKNINNSFCPTFFLQSSASMLLICCVFCSRFTFSQIAYSSLYVIGSNASLRDLELIRSINQFCVLSELQHFIVIIYDFFLIQSTKSVVFEMQKSVRRCISSSYVFQISIS